MPHLELAREIIRRFHHLFEAEVFPEPEPLLHQTAHKILGTDRRKMSKSYGNDIGLGNMPEAVEKKILSMITDEQRIRKTDPGRPDICNVFSYYQIFANDTVDDVRAWCEGAEKGCRDCKSQLAQRVIEFLDPIRKRRDELMADRDYLEDVLKQGAYKARDAAKSTLDEVRRVVKV